MTHSSVQSFMYAMNYPLTDIEDRASAFAWAIENIGADWPVYMDVPMTQCLFKTWRMVDTGSTGIVFANGVVPSITREEVLSYLGEENG